LVEQTIENVPLGWGGRGQPPTTKAVMTRGLWGKRERKIRGGVEGPPWYLGRGGGVVFSPKNSRFLSSSHPTKKRTTCCKQPKGGHGKKETPPLRELVGLTKIGVLNNEITP